MNFTQYTALENRQIMGTAQIQSLEILAMDSQELASFLQNEYLDNPLLDCTSGQPATSSIESITDWCIPTRKIDDSYDDTQHDLDARRNLTAPDPEYLKEYLISQLSIQQFSRNDWTIISYLIDCLEDSGFFTLSPAEVAGLTGYTKEQISDLLSILRKLEPTGIFAPDLPHCLLRQLEAMGNTDSCLHTVILQYLPELSQGKISSVSRSLNIPTAEVRKYMALISQLNPWPLSGLPGNKTSYIVPDIIFTKHMGQWEIAVNDQWNGEYHVNGYYVRMMKDTQDPELLQYFKAKLERCRFILKSIEQRHNTMLSISKAILEKQNTFFEGKSSLRPMTISELASELEIHPSTISRAIKGKYLQSPMGTVLIRNLFSAAVAGSDSDQSFHANQIKEKICELIDLEDKNKPFSDARLVELLLKQNVKISRRAVTKYREEMQIKSSFDRKIR